MPEFITDNIYGPYFFLFYNPLVIGYFVGSIPFGFLLTKTFLKKDIRSLGSGNIGATNVLRTGHKKIAFLTLTLDAFKGVYAVILIYYLMGWANSPCDILYGYCEPGQCSCNLNFIDDHAYKYFYAVIGAILGHCYPIWLKFKGGKGVATALGGLFATIPWVGLVACLFWLISFYKFRISSLAALIAFASTPISAFFIYGVPHSYVAIFIAIFIFWRHRGNIGRLRAGTEPKIGGKKEKDSPQSH